MTSEELISNFKNFPDDWIKVSDAALMARTSASTVRRWIQEGKLQNVLRVQGRYWIYRPAFEQFLILEW